MHDDTFIFDGTNYDTWKIYVLNVMRGISPDMEQILELGFSPPKDPKNRSLVEKRNSILDALASHVFSDVVSLAVIYAIMPF